MCEMNDLEVEEPSTEVILDSFEEYLDQHDPPLYVREETCRLLETLSKAHPMVFMAGMPGTGKTSLATAWARYHLQGTKGRFLHVVIPPGWQNPEDLLGKLDLLTGRYISTHILDFILDAVCRPDTPFVLLLDEADTSLPGDYLGTLSAALEGESPIVLHQRPRCVSKLRDDEGLAQLICNADCASCFFVQGGKPAWSTKALSRCVPPRLRLPSNVKIIATLNRFGTGQGLGRGLADRVPVLLTDDVDFRYVEQGATGEFSELYHFLKELEDEFQAHGLSLGWRCFLVLLNEGLSADSSTEWRGIVDEAMALRLVPRFNDPLFAEGAFMSDLHTFFEKKGKAFEVTRHYLARVCPQAIQKP